MRKSYLCQLIIDGTVSSFGRLLNGQTIKNIVSVLLAVLFLCSGCSVARAAETDEPLPCREAEDWNALFDRRGRLTSGWLAADGIYTVKTEATFTRSVRGSPIILKPTAMFIFTAIRIHCSALKAGICLFPASRRRIPVFFVYMHACNSGDLMYALGDSPIGLFSKPVNFYTAPENGQPAANGMDTLYTYNAKAHPALSPKGALFVRYNVNSSGEQYTTDDHPRFFNRILLRRIEAEGMLPVK